MANYIKRVFNAFTGKNQDYKKIYDSLIGAIGGTYTAYDKEKTTILKEGYGNNPDVFTIVNKSARKAMSVPFEIKIIKDKKAEQKLNNFKLATKGNFTPHQLITKARLESKVYDEDVLPFPMLEPNPLQSWQDIISLFKTYIDVVGDFYLYKIAPKEGMNKGKPIQVYALPADKVQIVLKKEFDLLSDENPIDYYILTDNGGHTKFESDEIIHIKTPNPFFDGQGKHLYGLSRLQAALRNIQSSNLAIDNNNKIMANSGVFGFIHGKSGATPLTNDQAHALKERLIQMDKDPSRLANIAGASGEIAFTRISLTTDELKPFDYLKFDRNVICNVLNFPPVLLENDFGGIGSSDKTIEGKKALLIDNVLPDLDMLAKALERDFLPYFKGYENTKMVFDISELPEMQQDMKALVAWLNIAPITKNEIRVALKYEPIDIEEMNKIYIPMNLIPIDQEAVDTTDFNNAMDK